MSIFPYLGSLHLGIMDYYCIVWVVLHCFIMGLYAHVWLYQNAMQLISKNQKNDCFNLESLHLSDMANFGPIGQISGSLCCCVLDCFYVLYLYGFLTSYSIIWSYQSSHLHIIQTNNFFKENFMALLNTPIICLIITWKSNFQCVGNVDVSYMDYCCTIWVLFNCSIRAWYAHTQLYQNAM